MNEYFRTYSGIKFYYEAPTIEMLNLNDVCRSLSMMNRFLGHTIRPYSVAEHSIRCSQKAKDVVTKREALIHDFAEAYYCDLPSPIKRKLGDNYRLMEESWQEQINIKLLGYSYLRFGHQVHEIDKRMCATESRDLKGHAPSDHTYKPYREKIPMTELTWHHWTTELEETIKELFPNAASETLLWNGPSQRKSTLCNRR